MKKHIPNLITGLNALSGSVALFIAMYGYAELAAVFILLGMFFDFFDGLTARLLLVKSEMGKELDSLADIISFGVAPAFLAHLLLRDIVFMGGEGNILDVGIGQQFLLFSPVLIPFFSAFRLAKFNLDVRQSHSFIGMPVPAHALFWVALIFAARYLPEIYAAFFGNAWVLVACIIILSLLLISELPMFSLKISGWGWKENKIQYLYFLTLIGIALIGGLSVILFIIPLYILFCVVNALINVVKR